MTLPVIVTPSEQQAPVTLFLRRLWGVMLRHVYLMRGSWPRFVEMMYWPMINILMWGFISLYLVKRFSDAAVVTDIFLGGVLLSEILLRTSIGVMVLFIEEIWSRNLGHLFASPLRFFDYITGILNLSLWRTLIALTPATFITAHLFGFSLFHLGWPLVAFIILLLMNGWWYGMLILALLFRYGLAAEWLGWMSSWVFIPIMAPYYPVSILPGWLQPIAQALPATYVFESMKSLLGEQKLHPENLWIALALNILYFIGSSFVLYRAYRNARRHGRLLHAGE